MEHLDHPPPPPPPHPIQRCQNGAFLLLRTFIIALGGKGVNCSFSFFPFLISSGVCGRGLNDMDSWGLLLNFIPPSLRRYAASDVCIFMYCLCTIAFREVSLGNCTLCEVLFCVNKIILTKYKHNHIWTLLRTLLRTLACVASIHATRAFFTAFWLLVNCQLPSSRSNLWATRIRLKRVIRNDC